VSASSIGRPASTTDLRRGAAAAGRRQV